MADLCSAPVHLRACGCLTPFGDAGATHAALRRGERALRPTPVLGREGGEPVPLALLPGRSLDEDVTPAWVEALKAMLAGAGDAPWGTAQFPVCVASSNFGVGSLYAFRRSGDRRHVPHGTPHGSVALVREAMGWGENIALFSHACVSAHVALLHASRMVTAGLAQASLVVSYDFLSPFVAGGFHALKILNGAEPAPYAARDVGSIALGDGAGFAVIGRTGGPFVIGAQSLHNELGHFTSNAADGRGFAAVLQPLRQHVEGRRVWVKGHGTGTLDAGRLEAEAVAREFPSSPLVGWKGSLGHTLGSCGLVELAIAAEALKTRRVPGTVGTSAPTFTPHVATAEFDGSGYDGVICSSNAFGGAHAALFLSHA